MRVLVTGSSGFVGSWLTDHLAAIGDEVLTLPDEVDIRDRSALVDAVRDAAPEGICHLAGQASVKDSWDDPSTTYAVNTIGVAHLLDAVGACSPPPRVLLVSSAEVYGRVPPGELPIGEDRPFAPPSPYGASKAAAELIGLQAWLGRGTDVVRARPFNHTGPRQRPDFVVPALARQVVEAASGAGVLRVGNLAARRDLTDVRDVVRAYRLLLEHGEPGGVYNVCRGASVPISEVLDRLVRLAAVEVRIEVDPARLRPADVPDLRGDPRRIEAATGWRPELDLDRTLADVLADAERERARALP
jgi:GDP-4-dehydro-6-deoxy-D-mannose reductase